MAKGSAARRWHDVQLYFSWFDHLEGVQTDGRISPAVKLTFTKLWREIGGRPGNAVLTATMIAGWFGWDQRTGRRMVNELEECGLVQIVTRDTRRGVMHVYVPDPNEGWRYLPPPPVEQMLLPGFAAEETAEVDLPILPVPTVSGADKSAQICPPGQTCANLSAPLTAPNGGGETPRAVLGSCVSSSRLTVNVESIDWALARKRANRVVRQLWPDRDFKALPLSKTDRTCLMRLCALAQFLGSKWLNTGVELAVDAHKKGTIRTSMLGWLRGTLANRARQATGYVIDDATLHGIPVPPYFLREKGDPE